MAHDNPWFLITHNELLMIQERAYTLGREIPPASSQYLGKIAIIVNNVRERQP
jgi:hypothetical protein